MDDKLKVDGVGKVGSSEDNEEVDTATIIRILSARISVLESILLKDMNDSEVSNLLLVELRKMNKKS